jgi:transcription elongation factor Elf1
VKILEVRHDHWANGRTFARRFRCRTCGTLQEASLADLILTGLDVVAPCGICGTVHYFWFVPGWVRRVLASGHRH